MCLGAPDGIDSEGPEPAHSSPAASSGPGRGPPSPAGQAARRRVPGPAAGPAQPPQPSLPLHRIVASASGKRYVLPLSEPWREHCWGHAGAALSGALSPGSSSDLTGESNISRAKKVPTSPAPFSHNDPTRWLTKRATTSETNTKVPLGKVYWGARGSLRGSPSTGSDGRSDVPGAAWPLAAGPRGPGSVPPEKDRDPTVRRVHLCWPCFPGGT